MNVLITGITGFAGSHLAEYLLENGFKIYGTYRWRSKTENILNIINKINLIDCDITDSNNVRKALNMSSPQYIFHLAAQSFVPTSWNAPEQTIVTNIVGNLNVLEASREHPEIEAIQIAGSSEEYGLVHQWELPITEDSPLRPLSPYGVSKVGQDMLSYQYFKSYDVPTIITRAFNHTGPRRGDVFVCSDFAKQVAMIEKGRIPNRLIHGNLGAFRDFTDVRDMVKAYLLCVEKGEPGERYNICSERVERIEDVLKFLISESKKPIITSQDPNKMRPSDVPILKGNCSKFRKLTGWKPKIPFSKTLDDLLEYWREKIG